MGNDGWERYRSRLRRENPLGRLVDQHGVVGGILAQYAELDSHVTKVVRGLGRAEFRAFRRALAVLAQDQERVHPGDAGAEDQDVLARLTREAANGKIALSQLAQVCRTMSVLRLRDRVPALRGRSGTHRGGEAVSAALPVFSRFHGMVTRLIDEILTQSALIDEHAARVVRALDPEEFLAFLFVLESMSPAARAEELWSWSVLVRQLEPACPSGAVGDAIGSARLLSNQDLADALQPLSAANEVLYQVELVSARLAVLLPQIMPGTADVTLDAALRALLADCRDLRDEQEEGEEDWKYVQKFCAWITAALGDSAVCQGHARAALREYRQAAADWASIDEQGEEAECLAKAAEAALADSGDVDEALEPLLRQLSRQAGPGQATRLSISQPQLLVRLAEIYLDVGDHFEASSRVEEAAQILDGLGFTDPADRTAEAVLAAWLDADPANYPDVPDGSTFATIAAVQQVWLTVTRVRHELAVRASPGSAGRLSETLEQLTQLHNQLGEEMTEVQRLLAVELTAAGLQLPLPAVPDVLAQNAETTAEFTAQAGALAKEESGLWSEWARCAGTGDIETMEALLRRTEILDAEMPEGGSPRLTATTVMVSCLRSEILLELNRTEDAIAVLAIARTRLSGHVDLAEAQRRSLLIAIVGREVVAQEMRGDYQEASRLCGEGISEVERDRGQVNAPYLQDSYLRGRGFVYTTGIWSAYKAASTELMLARSELAKARGMLGWAVTDPAPAAGSGPADAPAAGPADQADEAEFRALTTQLRDASAEALDSGERARLVTERRVLWDRLMMARSRSARTAPVPSFSIAALQAGLARDEAVISYHWLTRNEFLVVTIDCTAAPVVEHIRLADAERATLDDLADRIGALRQEAGAGWLKRAVPGLGKLLLPRAGRGLLAGKQRLIISPHRVLHQLPFHAFSYDGALLAERLAVSYVPNLTSLLLAARPAQPRHILALGVSAFTSPPLPALPNAGPEAETIAALYRQAGVAVTSLIDDQATAARLTELHRQGKLAAFTTLHLATHGDDGSPADSFEAALHLPGGAIDAMEISHWRLTADLVVLSACYSSRRAISSRAIAATGQDPAAPREELFGDEVFGLQAALFAAGARQVIGALWPADDTHARGLMEGFHARAADGVPTDIALRQAMLDLRAAGVPMYCWAPYKLIRLGGVRTLARSQHDQ
jgi:tetratricopeptide (TPR) repeat protein